MQRYKLFLTWQNFSACGSANRRHYRHNNFTLGGVKITPAILCGGVSDTSARGRRGFWDNADGMSDQNDPEEGFRERSELKTDEGSEPKDEHVRTNTHTGKADGREASEPGAERGRRRRSARSEHSEQAGQSRRGARGGRDTETARPKGSGQRAEGRRAEAARPKQSPREGRANERRGAARDMNKPAAGGPRRRRAEA